MQKLSPDKPDKVSAFNHRPVGDGAKPNVPNVVFKSTLMAVEQGRPHCGRLLRTVYSLDPAQASLLNFKLEQQQQQQQQQQ